MATDLTWFERRGGAAYDAWVRTEDGRVASWSVLAKPGKGWRMAHNGDPFGHPLPLGEAQDRLSRASHIIGFVPLDGRPLNTPLPSPSLKVHTRRLSAHELQETLQIARAIMRDATEETPSLRLARAFSGLLEDLAIRAVAKDDDAQP